MNLIPINEKALSAFLDYAGYNGKKKSSLSDEWVHNIDTRFHIKHVKNIVSNVTF